MTPKERALFEFKIQQARDLAWLLGAGSVIAVWVAWSLFGEAAMAFLGVP